MSFTARLPGPVKRVFRPPYNFVRLTAFYLSQMRSPFDARFTDATPVEAIVDAALNSPIKPYQVRSELIGLGHELRRLRPKVGMEIGTFKGGTLFVLSMLADPNATLISVDLPRGEFGGGYMRAREIVFRKFKRPGQSLHCIRANSHQAETVESVKRALSGRSLDYLFIDGDHTYEGVKKDFELYAPFVRKGGFIALHDIFAHQPEHRCEVDVFWAELKARYACREIIENPAQNWAGIGIVDL
jgi:predicted O-methyltransferase YrrM